MFSRRSRRRNSTWVSHDAFPHKYARYLNRSACYIGILIRNSLCQAHQLATALVTWQAAFFQAHYPTEFQMAVNQIHEQDE